MKEDQNLSELEEEIRIEMIRSYTEHMTNAVLGIKTTVTSQEAYDFLKRVRDEQEFKDMMYAFLMVAAVYEEEGEWNIVMSEKMLDFIRWLHQRNQRAKIYKGKKNGNPPELFGIPISIEKNATVPRFEKKILDGRKLIMHQDHEIHKEV